MQSSFSVAKPRFGMAHPKISSKRLSRRSLVKPMAVKVGEKAPDFELKDQNNKTVKLSKFFGAGSGLFSIGGKPVVIFFYPADGSPGCTREAKAFRDAYTELSKKMGAAVIGISSDSVDSHKNFCNELDLQFTLLSDEGGAVRKEYGVPKTLGLLDGRVTYIIDKTGTVVKVFDNQFAPEKHVEEAVAALESAKVKA